MRATLFRGPAAVAALGGGSESLPLDLALAEESFENHVASSESPEHAFDRAWAMSGLERAQKGLRDESASVETVCAIS
jgi:hypothetical protein